MIDTATIPGFPALAGFASGKLIRPMITLKMKNTRTTFMSFVVRANPFLTASKIPIMPPYCRIFKDSAFFALNIGYYLIKYNDNASSVKA